MIISFKNIALILLCFFSIQTDLFSQVINTDRPSQSASSVVIPENSLQIETGVQMTVIENGLIQFAIPTNLIRLNVVKGVELRFLNQVDAYFSNYSSDSRVIGMSDIVIGTKVQLLNKEDSKTSIAFLGDVAFPTGSFNNGREDYVLMPRLCVSHQLSDQWTVAYNLGMDFVLPESDDRNYVYTLWFGKTITKKMSIFIETYGNINYFSWDDSYDVFPSADAGITFLLRDNLQLDFSYGTGLRETSNFIAGGLSWNISPK